MSVFSIPFCHLSHHPGKQLFMTGGYERKGTRGGEAANGRHAAWSRTQGCSKGWAVEKTKFKEGHKTRGLNYSGSI